MDGYYGYCECCECTACVHAEDCQPCQSCDYEHSAIQGCLDYEEDDDYYNGGAY